MRFNKNELSEEDLEIYENLSTTFKSQFSKYYKIFKEANIKIIDNIFIDFLSKLTEKEILKFSSKIEWISKKWLTNLSNEIKNKVNKIFEENVEEYEKMTIILYLLDKYKNLSIEEIIESLEEYDISELEDWFINKRLKKAKDLFLSNQWIFELLDEISDKNLVSGNFEPRIDFI